MDDNLLSPYWYRIARLHPRLRAHVTVRMQSTRGQAWYVLHNQSTGRHHRINAQAFELVGRLDGRASVDEIWQTVLQIQGDEAPTQHDVIRIIGQLTDAGLVQAEVSPDIRQMQRVNEERGRKEKRARLNPLSFRLGLFNPSALMTLLYPRLKGLLTPQAFTAWCLLMLVSTVGVALNWHDIRAFATGHFMTPSFLTMAWLLYPVMKAIHELGHAMMMRRFGCEVPEVGVNFFLFVPMPYVDASAANRLTNRMQRALISAAGIMIELTLAAIGLGVWLSVEEGLLRELAFVVMTVGGLSTILFNGNPLMKFDGYFVACDLLDLPNLAHRSARFNDNAWQRVVVWLLRMPPVAVDQLDDDALERWALRLYAPLSWLYRLTVSGLMVSWASERSSWLGLGIVAWMMWGLVLAPCKNWAENLLNAPGFEAARQRASWFGVLAACGATALLALVPVPSFVVVDGVVWLPADAQVRATSDGEIDAMLVQSGQRVQAGQALIQLRDPALLTERTVLLAQIAGAQTELNAALGVDPLKAGNAQLALIRDQAQLAQVDSDLANQVLRATMSGEFVLSRQEDMAQRQVSRGQLLAYVLSDAPSVVRAVISQRDVGDVRHRVQTASVMLAERMGQSLSARQSDQAPAAVTHLPAMALSNKAGGSMAVDPTDASGLKLIEPMFVMDVVLQERIPRTGGGAKVRLDMAPRPLLQTWALRVRQLLLKHFSDVKETA